MRRCLVISLFVCFPLTCCLAQSNMVPNGSFEKGAATPDAWHVKLADYTVKDVEDKDGNAVLNEEGKKQKRYVCGCGQELGLVRPWFGLVCPKCGGFMGGEESGAWYLDNDKCVSMSQGMNGRAIKFTLPKDVGENQGVRAYSELIHVKPGWGYKIAFDAKTGASLARIFVEGFKYRERLPADFVPAKRLDPSGKQKPLDKCFRVNVNCGACPAWQHFTREILAPKDAKYRFEFLAVKLYAYMPGEASFDNVSIVPMTPKEYEEAVAQKDSKVKDKHFKYK